MKTLKNKILLMSAFIVIAGITITSCKKDKLDVNDGIKTDSYNNIGDFFNTNKVKSQFVSFSDSLGGTFMSAKGTKVQIAPYTFVDGLGDSVKGMVTMEFKDILQKNDMVLSNMATTTNNNEILNREECFLFV